jgi:hypothetical protein
MLDQRLVADQGKITGTITITCVDGDVNGLAELQGLHEELKLRPNIHTQGSIITAMPAGEVPPPVE